MRNEIFASRLKELRKEKNITQKALAMDIGVSLSSVINYENAQRFPVSAVISLLSKYFNVSKEYITGDSDTRNESFKWDDDEINQAVSEAFSPLLQRILTLTDNCNDFQKKMLFDILVELRHALEMNDVDKKSNILSLLQMTIFQSNKLVQLPEK